MDAAIRVRSLSRTFSLGREAPGGIANPGAKPRAAVLPADDQGLICGYWFAPGAAGRELALPDVDALLAGEEPGFAWLHFNLSHMGAQRWLQRQPRLTEAFHDALQSGLRSTRIERDENALVAVLNDVHFDFRYEPAAVATLWISVDSRLIVTARQSPLRSVDRLRLRVRQGEAMTSALEVLEHLLRAQGDVLIDIVRHVTQQVDHTEDQLLSGRLHARRASLGAQRRLLVRLQRLLAPEPASLLRLLQRPPAWIAPAEAQQLREAAEEFSVALQDMAALQERTKLLQEELGALLNERTSHSLFLLTIVTVLALPINILAGLFGMNVGGVPLAQDPHGFWLVAGLVLVFTACAAWWVWWRGRRE